MHKMWETAAVLVVIAIAAKFVVAYLIPALPLVIVTVVLLFILGGLYHRKRYW